LRIVILAGPVAGGLFALLAFSLHPAEAASMTFSSDATITSDQTIASDETWTIDGGVTLKIAAGVTIDD